MINNALLLCAPVIPSVSYGSCLAFDGHGGVGSWLSLALSGGLVSYHTGPHINHTVPFIEAFAVIFLLYTDKIFPLISLQTQLSTVVLFNMFSSTM